MNFEWREKRTLLALTDLAALTGYPVGGQYQGPFGVYFELDADPAPFFAAVEALARDDSLSAEVGEAWRRLNGALSRTIEVIEL